MRQKDEIRSKFHSWLDKVSPEGSAKPLPLTHIAKGVIAHRIIEAGFVEPQNCDRMNARLAYYFYGRPAYRYKAPAVVKLESSCPFCFLFDGEIFKKAKAIYPFDTGAFISRLYNEIIDEDFQLRDFYLRQDTNAAEKLISYLYPSRMDYIKGDRRVIHPIGDISKPYDLEAQAYISLLTSPGRNEPDDRIGSIEAQFSRNIYLKDHLRAIVVPHTHWGADRSPLLEALHQQGVDIFTYEFTPGRPAEHYHTLLEAAVLDFCKKNGII